MEKFIIKTSDSYNSKEYEMVTGNLISDEEKDLYIYNSKLGECRLEVYKEKVIITRKGSVNIDIEVNLNIKTKFLYSTNGFTKELFSLGEIIKKDRKNNLLEISYRIFDKNEEINKVNISIKKY